MSLICGFFLIFNFLSIVLVYNFYCIDYQGPSIWQKNNVCEKIFDGKIKSIESMESFLKKEEKKIAFENSVYVVTFSNNIKGVFKPVVKGESQDAEAEVAAYKASLFLNFPFVPPTTIKSLKIDGSLKMGSIQLFVESNMDSLLTGVYEKALISAKKEDVENLKIFYFVFGQWDTGPHNLIIVEREGRVFLIPIDNSGICNKQFVRYGDLPFVSLFYDQNINSNDFEKMFPFELAKVIEHATYEELMAKLGKTISVPHVFIDRIKRQAPRFFCYVVFQNSLWRQFHYGDDDFVKSFTKNISQETKKALKNLSFEILKNKIFDHSTEIGDEILYNILERRNQVLDYFKSTEKI
jgi:hypothetical protein